MLNTWLGQPENRLWEAWGEPEEILKHEDGAQEAIYRTEEAFYIPAQEPVYHAHVIHHKEK